MFAEYAEFAENGWKPVLECEWDAWDCHHLCTSLAKASKGSRARSRWSTAPTTSFLLASASYAVPHTFIYIVIDFKQIIYIVAYCWQVQDRRTFRCFLHWPTNRILLTHKLPNWLIDFVTPIPLFDFSSLALSCSSWMRRVFHFDFKSSTGISISSEIFFHYYHSWKSDCQFEFQLPRQSIFGNFNFVGRTNSKTNCHCELAVLKLVATEYCTRLAAIVKSSFVITWSTTSGSPIELRSDEIIPAYLMHNIFDLLIMETLWFSNFSLNRTSTTLSLNMKIKKCSSYRSH